MKKIKYDLLIFILLLFSFFSIGLLSGCSIAPVKTPVIKTYDIIAHYQKQNLKENNQKVNKKIKTTVYVTSMTANSPYDTTQMFYSNMPYQVMPYSYHQWVAPPASMLTDILTQKLNQSQHITAVSGNYIGSSKFRLTTHLNHLIQLFGQSKTLTTVELKVTAIITNSITGNTLKTKEFTVNIAAKANPEAMVKATNSAAEKIMNEISNWLSSSIIK